MDAEPRPSVDETDTLERVLRVMRDHELSGVPVTNEGGRCVGIITNDDLVIDRTRTPTCTCPHYFELFGGLVFVEPSRTSRDRLQQGHRPRRRRPDDIRSDHDRGRRAGAGGRRG